MKQKINNKTKKKVLALLGFAFVSGILGGIITIALIAIPNSPLAKFIAKNSGPIIQENRTVKITEESAQIEASKIIAPSVVSIVTLSNVTNLFGQKIQQQGGGSGIVVSSDGLILTNKHVANDSNAQYTIFLADGKSYSATVKSVDPLNDLAILKIEVSGLKAAELGDSNDLQIAQNVIAVGFALGEFKNTVTAGIISGFDRAIEAENEKLEGMLQTDAAINSGNSGGPLVNMAGQVIGINTAVASSAENIGFAIPINLAKKAIEDVKKYGRIRRPFIGVHYVEITPQIAKANNLGIDHGALVYSNDPGIIAVVPSGPAAKAGVKEGDIIISLNKEKIDSGYSLNSLLQKYSPGDKVEITFFRDGKEHKANLILGENK
ncbi:MAG: trypsin-like peptidase domain-containing protein [Patescibacteria group bacterium]|nr:trypsin-like peptidase domain-containing protein [Patescibacteria group bacterium]